MADVTPRTADRLRRSSMASFDDTARATPPRRQSQLSASKDHDDSACDGQHFDIERSKLSEDATVPETQLNRKGLGSWVSAGYHMGTTIAVPAAILPLPFAFSQVGWAPAITALLLGTVITYYASMLLASLFSWNGGTYYTYRDLVQSIFGRAGFWMITFLQQLASVGNNVAITIVAGQSMKALYVLYNPDGEMFKLPYCIIIFGFVQFLMSQLPDLHSLRFLNALSNFCTVTFSTIAVGMSIHNGYQQDRSAISYELLGDISTKVYGVFLALGAIAFAFGNPVLPEIQATIKAPAIGNMWKGITMAYALITSTYFSVAISGYWAFGQNCLPYLLNNLSNPSWPITIANLAAIVQITGCYQVFCRPTYESFESRFCNIHESPFSRRNLTARLCITLTYNVLMTFLAALIPFFTDFVALIGAIGFIPLDFILPLLLWLRVQKPHRWWSWGVNYIIIIFYSIVAIGACVAAIRQIHLNIGSYGIFADL